MSGADGPGPDGLADGRRRHTFRFFVGATCRAGEDVHVTEADTAHLRVLRLATGASVEVVDTHGVCWTGRITDPVVGVVQLEGIASEAGAGDVDEAAPAPLPVIELVAGVLTGHCFDELVDGAVQAGADRIVPFAATAKEAERIGARRDRLTRIAVAAAKQSKRTSVPEIGPAIDAAALLDGPPGTALDAGGDELLPVTVRRAVVAHRAGQPMSVAAPVRVLVGAAGGLDGELLDGLRQRGWEVARLGPTILRSELAGPVAVATAVLAALEALQERRAERHRHRARSHRDDDPACTCRNRRRG